MVSTSHIKVSLLSIPLLSRKLHFQVMSFNNGCVITYWSERADEEKEMTEEERGESGQDDQDDQVAEIALAGAIRDEKVEGLSKKAENGDANCETERDNKGKTAPSEEMERRNKIGSGIEDKREIEKEPQVQPIQVHVEVCIIL